MNLPKITDDQMRWVLTLGIVLMVLISWWSVYKIKPKLIVLAPEKVPEKVE